MTLNYKEFGQGYPIIILHGLFGTLDNWQTIAKQLAKDYSVYIIDQRNHGKSPHDDAFDYAIMAEDLKEFMEAHWIHEAHIIGHSMGGKAVMQFAKEYADMVSKLVVVDIAPVQNPVRHTHIFEALNALPLATLKNRTEADKVLQTKIDSFGERQFLLKNLTRKREGGYEFKMNLPAIEAAYPNILAPIEYDVSFENPTLIIRGGNSKHIMPEHYPIFEEMYDDVKIETIEDADHWVHADKPAELLQIVKNFLED